MKTSLVLLLTTTFISAELDFNRDVRPILSDKCFACHGPDAHDRKGDLRLDTFEGATRENDGSRAIVPGNIKDSEVWHRLITDDADDVMPPKKLNKPLNPREKEILKEWIESGAEYEPHWSYTPLKKTAPQAASTPAQTIDLLIDAARTKAGFKNSPPADPTTLVRRLSLDLRGLAPSSDDLATYTADPTPAAYNQLVDRYLNDPAYGERMAVYWLDLARYADTIGYHSDNNHPVTPYRDYVINSFNSNLPYDQFVREQLAGDLLPNATIQQKVASTYNRLLQTTEEGGAQAREYEKIYAADRVRNSSALFLGATIGCAQCHDHKFDPFTAHDFYAYAAFFDDIKEVSVGGRKTFMNVPTPEETKEQTRLLTLLHQHSINKAIQNDPTLNTGLTAHQKAWEQNSKHHSTTATQHPVIPKSVQTSGSKHKVSPEGLVHLLPGDNPAKENITVVTTLPKGHYTGFVLDVFNNELLPNKGYSASGNGNFLLSQITVLHKGKPINLTKGEATFEQPHHTAQKVFNGNPDAGWSVLGHQNQGGTRSALFTLQHPIKAEEGDELKIILKHESHFAHHVIGKFKLTLTTSPKLYFPREIGPTHQIAILLNKPEAQRTPAEKQQLTQYYRSFSPLLDPQRKIIEGYQTQLNQLVKGMRKTLASQALPKGQMRTTTLLNRGDWMDKTGPVVPPAVPAFLSHLGPDKTKQTPAQKPAENTQTTESERLNRLDLANWITHRDNPLTARTYVNRLWMLFFGRGIAADVADLGGQGTMPDNPELLDFLASQLIESNWDTKQLLKTILLSKTYQQSSQTNGQTLAADPDNVHLSRQGRWRLDAEFVRDVTLQHAGLLVQKEGGDSVKPHQPDGYWAQLNFPKRKWEASAHLPDRYRRGLYTYWCRSFLHPSMIPFDAPTREECTPQRTRSNVPQQALVLLNDPSYVEAAQALAKRTIKEAGPTDPDRINWLFQQLLSRQPQTQETQLLTNLLQKKRTTTPDADEVTLWSTLTRALINTYETTSRF